MGWELCWRCESHKPHRAHHCYQCRTCILKRDHHCIFAVNCVGHANMRYTEKINVREFFFIFEKKFNFRENFHFILCKFWISQEEKPMPWKSKLHKLKIADIRNLEGFQKRDSHLFWTFFYLIFEISTNFEN